MTDLIRRLWFLLRDEYVQGKRLKCVYIADDSFEFNGVIKEFLDILGVRYESWERVSCISRFKKVILPDECFYNDKIGNRYFTQEYRDIINTVRNYALNNSVSSGIEKVYFSYGLFREDKFYGEKKLEDYFRNKGYTVIAPHKYTLKERLNLLCNCRSFASTEGTDSHNTVFLQDGAEAIIIPRTFSLNAYQLALNDLFDLKVSYVDSSLSIFGNVSFRWDGPFFFFVSEELRRFFGDGKVADDNYLKSQFFDFDEYYKAGSLKNKDSFFDMPKYYQKAAIKYFIKLWSLESDWALEWVEK